ncbi:sensor histidine kinase [Flavitalea antarctica]
MNINKALDIVYRTKSIRIALHLFFWIVIVLIQFYLSGISFNSLRGWPRSMVFANIAASAFATIIFYYPFVYWVLPQYFYRKRFVIGIIQTFVLLVIFALADIGREEILLKNCSTCMAALERDNSGYFPFMSKDISTRLLAKVLSLGSLIGLIFTIALPLSIKYAIMFMRQQFLSLQLSRENLQLEFNFLRSQVNPHFLFNTLNNIYGLIMNDQKTKSLETVAGLTQFLRYSLYESNSDLVAVDKEVQLMRNYIDLESIRLNHITVKFNYQNDGTVKNMAPLLLVPVIENAFKHTEDVIDAYIKIDFFVDKNHIILRAENSGGVKETVEERQGIGIRNLQKRLNLYYPGKYAYEVSATAEHYIVSINIESYE